jgi:hypothetical protein
VIGIVEPDTDELADAADASAKARLTRDERQRRGIERAKARKARIGQRVARDVVNVARKIADVSVGVDKTRFFLAFRPKAKQFHGGEIKGLRNDSVERAIRPRRCDRS